MADALALHDPATRPRTGEVGEQVPVADLGAAQTLEHPVSEESVNGYSRSIYKKTNTMEKDQRFSPRDGRTSDVGTADVTVIIPALNEADALPLVLRDLPPVQRILVVNNGSTDDTAAVAIAHGATVAHEPKRGYGAACLRGLAALGELVDAGEPPPQVVVFLDADYSDHPDLLPELVQPIVAGEADLVLGSRLLGEREAGAMPAQSLFGNRLACFLMRLLFGARYTDLGPFRAIDYGALGLLGMSDEGFGWTIEMQIKAARAGLRAIEVPVPYRCRVGESKISGTCWGSVKAGTKILYTIAKYAFTRRSIPTPPPSSPNDRPSRTEP